MSTFFFPRTKFEVHNFSHVCSYHLYCIPSVSYVIYSAASYILCPLVICRVLFLYFILCNLSYSLLCHVPSVIYPVVSSLFVLICPVRLFVFILKPSLSFVLESFVLYTFCIFLWHLSFSLLCLHLISSLLCPLLCILCSPLVNV